MTTPEAAEDPPPLRLWVDADACPVTIKQLIFRTAQRLRIEAVLVANQTMRAPRNGYVRTITVPDGPDVADDRIAEGVRPGDVVVTGDIPLSARVVAAGGVAIGVRGELLDDATVHDRLASRDLMEEMRAAGVETRGPKPLSPKDLQTFANSLDRTLTKALRKRGG
ncbi:hypothetical protein Pla108_24590 [Botrimarina colliarenosi]|uniref:UPF0178 protein Pla108_24590 n=1 Tax=Botrimarina colliarenosi TaxID=2528001 RepID=A0A5C6AC30_9BACT|nr:YaiI/YqxD family protein [Botrimarina colliarenosi]TWT96685.1 hypothetical protein Pla108_24590 [Botrimarina colliarenosi]